MYSTKHTYIPLFFHPYTEWSWGWEFNPKTVLSSPICDLYRYLPDRFFFFFYLHFLHHTQPLIVMRKFVHVYERYMSALTSPSSVWSLRKFQFPWDKLHFTANLFPALVRRKIGVRSTFSTPTSVINCILRGNDDSSQEIKN